MSFCVCVICVFYLLVFSASSSLFSSVILASADGATEGEPNMCRLLKPRKLDVCLLPIPCADEIPKTFVVVCVPITTEEGGCSCEREKISVSKRLEISELE